MAPACINWCRPRARCPTILLSTERFDIDEAFRLIERHRVTNIFTVPTILKMMVEHPRGRPLRSFIAALRHLCRRADVSQRSAGRADQRSAGCWCNISGWARLPAISPCLPRELHDPEDGPDARIGSCGFAPTGMQVSIQGDDGRELKPFENRRDLRHRPRGFRRLLRQPRSQCQSVSRRLVSHRRSRSHG